MRAGSGILFTTHDWKMPMMLETVQYNARAAAKL